MKQRIEKYDELIGVFKDTRIALSQPDNDYSWSSWENAEEALREIDEIIAELKRGSCRSRTNLAVLFAPTGPIQEVSLGSGWGDDFLRLAERFDTAVRCIDN